MHRSRRCDRTVVPIDDDHRHFTKWSAVLVSTEPNKMLRRSTLRKPWDSCALNESRPDRFTIPGRRLRLDLVKSIRRRDGRCGLAFRRRRATGFRRSSVLLCCLASRCTFGRRFETASSSSAAGGMGGLAVPSALALVFGCPHFILQCRSRLVGFIGQRWVDVSSLSGLRASETRLPSSLRSGQCWLRLIERDLAGGSTTVRHNRYGGRACVSGLVHGRIIRGGIIGVGRRTIPADSIRSRVVCWADIRRRHIG